MEENKEKPDDSSDYYGSITFWLERKMTAIMIEEAYKLNQAIKESQEYIHYHQAMKKVMENQELYQAMNIFRRRNYELQSYDDGINRYQEIHNLGLEYEKILRNPVVNEFLVAEQIFSRKMTEVYEIIAKELELDYSYME